MNVYTVEADLKQYAYFYATDVQTKGTPVFDGKSYVSEWEPREGEFTPGSSSDFYDVEPFLGVLGTKKGVLSFLKEVQYETEVLGLDQNNDELILLNVTNIIDCWDESKSLCDRTRSGRILYVRDYYFDESLISDTYLFKIPQMADDFIFATQKFVDLINKMGSTGLEFQGIHDRNLYDKLL